MERKTGDTNERKKKLLEMVPDFDVSASLKATEAKGACVS